MAAIVVFQFTARDPGKLAEYSAKALPIVAAHCGRALGIGVLSDLFGTAAFERGAAFEFPDRASATAWYESSDYQALVALRGEAMDCCVTMIG